ncbi:MAG: glycosyltransferase family 2 protein [Patescibacteria group bacterium]|nr:glycosyltransferase family 2 protein [Patescibacteria group bacterium]
MDSSNRHLKITVIVLTYNSSRYLDGCFGTLGRMETDGLEVKVVAVDNGSSDGTPDEIRKRWPRVKVVDSGGNIGFAAGNNLAMRRAVDSGDDYVFLLNHDTEVEPGFLKEAVLAMERDPKIGSAQSLLLLHPERDLVNGTGNAIHFMGFGYCMDYRKRADSIDRETVRDIPYASGAAVLYRCDSLRTTGLFDDSLFMYHEDLDLGWRLRLCGFRNVLAPKSVVYHKYEFSRSIGKYYYMERNRYIVLLKNLRLWTFVVLAPGLVLTEAVLMLAAFHGGWWRKKFQALMYFMDSRSWRNILAERGRVEKIRKVSDRRIVREFTPVIRGQESTSLFAHFIANPLMEAAWRLMRLFII